MAQADSANRATGSPDALTPPGSRTRQRAIVSSDTPDAVRTGGPRRRGSRGGRRHKRPGQAASEPEAQPETAVDMAPPPEDRPKPKRTRGSRGGRGRKKPQAIAEPQPEAVAEAPQPPRHSRRRKAETPAVVVEAAAFPTAWERPEVEESAPPAAEKPKRTRTRRARQPEPQAAYDDVAPGPKTTSAPVRARIPVTGAPSDVPPPFAHNAEYEFARILDFYGIAWEYEPRSFPLRWERAHVTEAFTPDFFLPDLKLFVELTTLKSGLTAEKNRKMRTLKELYPDINIIMLKKRDYLRLLAKYGYGAIGPSQVPDIDRVLITAEKINQRVQELGAQISSDYAGKEPVLIGVLRGVLPFMADLMRQISVPTSIDLMSISSYDGNGSAAVRILKDLDLNIKGRDVILVEDIVDTGMTLNTLLEYFQTKRPASVKICAMLNKPARRLVNVPLDYIGFDIPDEFVVGYGLDFNQRFRNLPFVGTLRHELLP